MPEGHTDFIFATMAEEWGLMGGIFLIVAFGLVLAWGVNVALDAKDRFSRLAAAGLAPVVGIPLPLFSQGGSAMLTVMLCLGALMSIERQNRRERGRR